MKVVRDMADGFRNGIDWLADVTPPWLVVVYAIVLVSLLATR